MSSNSDGLSFSELRLHIFRGLPCSFYGQRLVKNDVDCVWGRWHHLERWRPRDVLFEKERIQCSTDCADGVIR